ncbi:tetratricopeptide repeat protein [Candidatus Leptofilum sp.]|uniref:tetratricopeptide repeat protein n=1 Tax=Candidatus Leptofilum sp. TaxID=3241576 RepID=UPI003B5B5E2A
MTSILLHEYVEQVETLVDASRLVEAIEHCRHILHHYPRHIDTYRVMGKALLEKQDYDAAADLFLRILGADPNDFISHVGLSIVYQEESQYDQALWHLERAFEIQPYNVAIQGELRQLYAVETETRPGVIPLTRGALARLYMQGELYQQAISELRRILADEPERMDLQVLLAEALWRDDQRIDAEEVCLKVLEELPNCIVLNAILAEIWLQTGRIPEAQKYLKRLHGLTWQTQKSLQKESIAGRAFASEGAFPLPEEASLEFLETGTVVPDKPAEPTDDWVGEVTFDDAADASDHVDDIVLEPESGMHSYDWLADIGAADEDETAASEQKTSETDWFSQTNAKDALNLSTSELNADWLADLRGEVNEEDESGFQPLEMDSEPGDEATEATQDDSDWFTADGEFSDELFAELADSTGAPTTEDTAVESDHDWLKDLADVESEESSEPEGKSGIQIDATNLMDESLMDWDQLESDPNIVQEPKTPFWLSEMAGESVDAVELNPEEALEWLVEPEEAPEAETVNEDSASEGTDTPQDPVESQDASPETVEESLDWLDEISSEDSAELPVEDAVGPTAVLDPNEQSDLPEMPDLTDTDSLGEADDWLAALTEGTIEEEISWDGDEGEHKAEDIQLDATTDELASLSDDEDWLESASADLETILEATKSEEEEFPNLLIPDMEGAEIEEIPDWLHTESLDHSEEAETAMSSENDPQEKPQADEPEVEPSETGAQNDEQDALDWLADLTDEDQAEADVPLEPPIATEGMPSWLDEVGEKADVEVVDEWDSESADIPDWLQDPVELSDLDDDILDKSEEIEEIGLTGLLSEMDVSDEAVPLDDMDSLFSDWSDEDGDGSLTELLGEMGLEESAAADDDDLSGFLADDVADSPAQDDDFVGLGELADEEVSLTAMLSEIEVGEDEAAPTAVSDEADDDWLGELTAATDGDDDWLADLTEGTDEAAEPDTLAGAEEAEAELGLTGMLANLWPDEDDALDETGLSETAVSDPTDAEPGKLATDELGLTELLAGIEYAEDVVDSRPELPELDEPVEPSLTEILTDMETEPDAPEPDEAAPISAEDTTWLTQLEADTGALQEQEDSVDMAEETGLDWLTLPDEPEEMLPEDIQEESPALDEPEVVVEQDSTPEDWDDAMSWLEELAAQQEDPVGELPSVAENMLDEELDTSEALQMEAPVEDEEFTGGTDWLDDLTGDVTESEEEAVDPALLAETRVIDEIPLDADETAVPLDESADEDDPLAGWEDDSEMSWLDELATDRLPETAVDDDNMLGDLFDDVTDEMETAVDEAETIPDPIEATAQEEADDASWLDELVTDDEVDADDIGWLDTIVDADEEETETVAQELPDVEAELVEEVTEPEEVPPTTGVAGVTDALKADDGLDEAEADLEEALAWLDELEEEPEATLPDEAPPTIVTPPEPHDLPELTVDKETPETVVLAPEPDELTLALERLEQQVKDEGIAVPETGVFPIMLSDEELHAALDWIEQSESAPETAAPIVDEPVEDAADSDPVLEDDDLSRMADDPEAWLEDLLSDDTALDVEIEPPPIKPSEDAVFVTDTVVEAEPEDVDIVEPETADSLLDDVPLEGMPDDPDAAVAWLDQLVSGDDALDIEMEPPPIKPSEDAVFVTDDAPQEETEIVEAAPEPESLAEAAPTMEDDPEAWLEQMLSGDLAMDVEMEPPPIKPSEDAVFVTDDAPPAETAEAAPSPEEIEALEEVVEEPETIAEPQIAHAEDAEEATLDLGDMEDDPEAWLEQMLSDDLAMDVEMEPPPIKPSDDAVFVTDDAPQASEPEASVEPATDLLESDTPDAEAEPTDDIIAEVPDDPDEAMAWLEQLAARQGADLEELPSVTDEADLLDEPEMPDWMEQDLAELDAEPDEAVAEAPAAEEIADVSVDTGDLADEDVDSELPDWLDSSDERPVVGETDWLRTLPDVDMDSWLSAEAEAATIEPEEEIQLPDTGPLRSTPTDTDPLLEDELFEPVIEPSSGAYSVDEAKLGVAQEALADGRIDEAVTEYKTLVAEGSGMMAIIAELEQAADAHPQAPALFQVLGDAYMRNGQLQKALAAYRSALNQM